MLMLRQAGRRSMGRGRIGKRAGEKGKGGGGISMSGKKERRELIALLILLIIMFKKFLALGPELRLREHALF